MGAAEVPSFAWVGGGGVHVARYPAEAGVAFTRARHPFPVAAHARGHNLGAIAAHGPYVARALIYLAITPALPAAVVGALLGLQLGTILATISLNALARESLVRSAFTEATTCIGTHGGHYVETCRPRVSHDTNTLALGTGTVT